MQYAEARGDYPIEAESRRPDHRLIRQVAQQRMGHRSLPEIVVLQALTEWKLRLFKHVSFRKRENAQALRAYNEMRIQEFEGINARQAWSNWRTIPKNLSCVSADRPFRALDLCCGTGQSTEVLACYLPEGSRVLGLEFNSHFVERARKRRYLHLSGRVAQVSFRAQSVLDQFLDDQGETIASGSVDLVNSSGAVGFHFDDDAIRALTTEVARVLTSRGWALIDLGLPGKGRRRLIRAFEDAGFVRVRSARSWFGDPRGQVCFRKR